MFKRLDDGKGNRQRYDADGNPLTPEEAHGKEPKPRPESEPKTETKPQPEPQPKPTPVPTPRPASKSGPSTLKKGLLIIGGFAVIVGGLPVAGPTGEEAAGVAMLMVAFGSESDEDDVCSETRIE